MNKNYKLLVIDRRNIKYTECYILPASFMKRYVKKQLKNTVKVEGGYMGYDDEEFSYLWQTTDQKVNKNSKLFIEDMEDYWLDD
jgi:hypothetical protein